MSESAESAILYWCPECGIVRHVAEGGSTICEINGAGAQMESISEGIAQDLARADRRIAHLERVAIEAGACPCSKTATSHGMSFRVDQSCPIHGSVQP